jgi:predicted choloylglycine hydrolase
LKLFFRWNSEDRPGRTWSEQYERSWPSYRAWFLKEGESARADLKTCRKKLGEFMPELIPTWERLSDLALSDPLATRMLALWNPAPFIGACSQAIWLRDEPFLVRNYDFHPHACEGQFLLSSWHGRKVLASTDCLWGALDGMNESGLVGALSFGGRRVMGQGFGIPLILRYLLEFCTTVPESTKVLTRIPSHMAYNITLLDREGRHAVVEMAPDRPPVVRRSRVSTNIQEGPAWSSYHRFSRSAEREQHLKNSIRSLTAKQLVEDFMKAPLYTHEYERGMGTLYTVVYRPTVGKAEYHWLGAQQQQDMNSFVAKQIELRYS